ncbi:MAG: bifunctional DNA-formamidopyrimidine glycosylase/DNA-(apurinic or apyrimidinic site) lyase [Acidobacteriaceae bacterium]|nr:bifunctional DNA-formamidopyrimidine glycosylase/DNA-(apurinic or apyrimidinic site) lyase [Acidobacteriaceae bacterium]
MPELPEVETVVRSIAPHITGQKIVAASVLSHRVTRGDHAQTASQLTNARILAVRRRGKQILIDLDKGLLYVHLGMTGKLLWNGRSGKYTRAFLEFKNGTLLFDDIRTFGRFEFFSAPPANLTNVGPDALVVSFEEFYSRMRKRKGSLKVLLLNQSFIAGVGNIYADEALFAARIHPLARSGRLSERRARVLYESLGEVLALAIEHRGSSISDYVDGAGEQGSFQSLHNVYGRQGETCLRCEGTIRRIVVAQRGTHYCPRCQRV